MKNYKRNRIAFAYFQAIGKIPYDAGLSEWCLHHVDTTLKYTDRARYDEWRVEDLVPMLRTEHNKLHGELKHGSHLSEETKRKISEAQKGVPKTEEQKEHIRQGMAESGAGERISAIKKELYQDKTKCPMYGRHHSEETKRKMSEARKGRPGRKWTDEAKRKMSRSRRDPIWDKQEEVVCRYEELGSVAKTAAEYGADKALVYRMLKDAGVVFHRSGWRLSENARTSMMKPKSEEHRRNISKAKRSPLWDKAEEIAEKYRETGSTVKVAKMFGVSQALIYNILRKNEETEG